MLGILQTPSDLIFLTILQGVYYLLVKKYVQKKSSIGQTHRASRWQSCVLKPCLFDYKAHTLSFAPLCLNKRKEFLNIYNKESKQFKEMFTEKGNRILFKILTTKYKYRFI